MNFLRSKGLRPKGLRREEKLSSRGSNNLHGGVLQLKPRNAKID